MSLIVLGMRPTEPLVQSVVRRGSWRMLATNDAAVPVGGVRLLSFGFDTGFAPLFEITVVHVLMSPPNGEAGGL